MTVPIESTITLVESIMSDVRQSEWKRLPPDGTPKEVVEGVGSTWRTLVVRWKQGEDFHYEAVATSKMKATPFVVRLPPSEAAAAWLSADRTMN